MNVDRLTYGGEGIGRSNGLAIFVTGSAPGDKVRARVRRVYRRHVEADILEVQTASSDRVEPRCSHFLEGCGGCCWQHVSYQAQLAAKGDAVRDSLERLGGFRDVDVRPTLPAREEYYYRNKMEFAFHPQGVLGLHPRGAWYDILPLRACLLPSPLALETVKAAQRFAAEHDLSLYHPRSRQGLLQELSVRQSRASGEILVGIVTGRGTFAQGSAMATYLAAIDPKIAGVVRTTRETQEGRTPLGETSLLCGRDHIVETIGDLRFRIHVDTFFQTNSAQADRLLQLVMEFAGDVNGAKVVDVYCGVGLFSLALARAGAQVVGVEIAETAVEAARENARANGLSSPTFHAGDARKVLAEVLPAGLAPRVLVLDPPRAGAGGKVMRRIARSCPERIVYVSCNPTTLARDLVELRPFGYKVTAVQPIDLFPQTYHVETVVALEHT